MTRRLTVRERDRLPIGSPDGVSGLEAAALAELQPVLPSGSLTWEHRAIRFGPFCGVLRAGSLTIELLPKIDDGQDPTNSARGLLVAMLRATGTLAVTKAGETVLGQQRQHLLDQFILDFCARVNTALHGGPIARYEDQEENLSVLRGRLAFADHVRHNANDRSRLFCRFDERTIDNPHNRALKSVISSLRANAIGNHAKASISALLHRFDQVATRSVTPDDLAQLVFDRTMSRWQPVFEQAKWLLQGLFPDLRSGKVEGTCLLFNMERLFETFLGVKLRQAWRSSPRGRCRTVLQGPSTSLARSGTGDAFRLRPDVTIFDEEGVTRMFDAKWKRLEPGAPSFGVSPSDVYQVVAYASRYGCHRVGLVHPTWVGCSPRLLETFELGIPGSPTLELHAVDIRDLCFGGSLPRGLRPGS